MECNVVLGYSESTLISDDLVVVSASGTAAFDPALEPKRNKQ